MKHNTLSFIRRQWLFVWTMAVSIILFSIAASAEATVTRSPMNRVLVTKDGHGILFSSNILSDMVEETVSGVTTQKATYQPSYKDEKTNEAYVVDLNLWNYDTLDETTRYPENINYRLDVRLTHSEGGNTLTAAEVGTHTVVITPTSPSGTPVTLSSSNLTAQLTGQSLIHSDSRSTQNSYTVSFSAGWDLDNDTDICVEIIATPTLNDSDNPYSDVPTLGRIIGLRKSRTTGSNGWKATISEKTDTNSPTEFDGYNLILSGSGSATITISWDTTKIGVNKYIYSMNNVFDYAIGTEIIDQGKTDGWHTITIKADSSTCRNRYAIQLYKLGNLNDSTSPSSWSFFAYNANSPSANDWIRVNIT